MRIARLLEDDSKPPFPRGVAIALLLIAGAGLGLIFRGAASAQRSEPEQNTSTKRMLFDSHGGDVSQGLLVALVTVPANATTILPIAGYFVVTSAPTTLTEGCAAGGYSSSIITQDVFTAIQVQ